MRERVAISHLRASSCGLRHSSLLETSLLPLRPPVRLLNCVRIHRRVGGSGMRDTRTMPIGQTRSLRATLLHIAACRVHPRVIALWSTVIHRRFRLLPQRHCLCSLLPNVRLGSRTERLACVPITSTHFALLLVLSFSGARHRNRRSRAAETSSNPAPRPFSSLDSPSRFVFLMIWKRKERCSSPNYTNRK